MNQPKKSLGQHWLFDEDALAAMLEAGEVGASDTVLEIGPGLGSLTLLLTARAKEVVAIEADEELASALPEKVPAANLSVETGDILQFDASDLSPNYKVVANIPYYLTSKILQYLLEVENPPQLMTLLMQKEVAERIVATPGQMSVLAFSVQYYAEPEICGYVGRELFEPVPKVDSAILKVRRRSEPYFPADTSLLFRLVKAGFGERRKKLANSLAGGLRCDKQLVQSALNDAGIEKDARAQELNLDEWSRLYTAALTMGLLKV